MPNAVTDTDALLAQILRTLDVPQDSDTAADGIALPDERSPAGFVKMLRQRLYFGIDVLKARYRRLIGFKNVGGQKHQKVDDVTILHRLAAEVSSLPDRLCKGSSISRTIQRIHDLILTKLDARVYGDGAQDASTINDTYVETCSICDDGISFESLHWSRCSNGHQYSESVMRCSSMLH